MEQNKHTREAEERASGIKTALFSVAVTFTAVFLCGLVLLLTMQGKAPVPPAEEERTLESEPIETAPPEGPSVPVFTTTEAALTLKETSSTKALSTELASSYGILVDAQTGEILAGKNAHVRFNPASMTKVMTLIVACERLNESDLDRKLQLTQDVHDYMTQGGYAGAATSFIKKLVYLNDFVSVRDALYGVGVSSAADATYLICKAVAGSEADFVTLMNQKASELGLENTHFDNAIGHESENNYTTAADMAAIMAYALRCDLICDILSCKSTYACTVYSPDVNGDPVQTQYNWYLGSSLFDESNSRSRFSAYRNQHGKSFSLQKATFGGGKTGTLGSGSATDPWVYSLVTFATYQGKTYIVVTGEVVENGAAVLSDAKLLYDSFIK